MMHYNDVIMSAMASQITSITIIYSTVHSGADQRKHQCSASLTFVMGIHRWPVNSPHKGPVKRKMFPFDDVIMEISVAPHRSHRILSLISGIRRNLIEVSQVLVFLTSCQMCIMFLNTCQFLMQQAQLAVRYACQQNAYYFKMSMLFMSFMFVTYQYGLNPGNCMIFTHKNGHIKPH